ncbi:methylamine dehydrogenase accessory protein MauD [Bradyrhizobium sp. 83002]|uniref:methylamine dehydrogenase accessory protein MauD n=1 Tax=Bradyrhizobium aeschynomenes TaxID=2734909 RepID=UPI001554142B|nr:methylamine dehydrogenase accessory protein MauD [Bradyrhizobium aeschynomenes]NPU14705.1 methylamine dehydrogenase accessory protein MauD [Bradyrhizobium aeschynomenes]NPV21434.1 methylamine dehydrogenase accessory protein MauD [Bradyrhizobium aeschynomenes]
MDGLVVAFILLCILVLGLAIAVFALARQVGILYERISPMGALMTDSGPAVGEKVQRFDLTALDGRNISIGAAGARSQLVFFLSPTCPVCKKLLPILSSVAAAESSWLDLILAGDGDIAAHRAFVAQRRLDKFPFVLSRELGLAFRVSRLPYAALIDGNGLVRAKGLINNREQLESLFNARDLGVASIQSYLDAPHPAH